MTMHRHSGKLLVLMMLGTVLVSVGRVEAGPARCQGQVVTIQVGPDGEAQGTSGPDVIRGTSGNDRIRGGGGDDIICAGGGRDRVSGGPGDDVIVLGPGRDIGRGNAGDDRLVGNGRDRLIGGRGTDVCLSRGGRVTVIGCEGNGGDGGGDGGGNGGGLPADCSAPVDVGTTCRIDAPALGRVLDVRLIRVVDPAPPADDLGLPAGTRLVAVQVSVTNRGSGEWSRGTFGVSLTASNGGSSAPSLLATPLGEPFGRPTIPVGQSASGWVTFELPDAVGATSLRWSECCGDQLQEVAAVWRL